MKTFPSDIREVLRRLGDGAYLVGGTVRDLLRDVEPRDTDIIVPDISKAHDALKSFCSRVSQINSKGTLEASYGGRVLQVTQMDKRGLLADLNERDFTINALAMDNQGMVTDYLGRKGDAYWMDTSDWLIRPVRPEKCFHDSPIRLLRLFRFSAETGYFWENEDLVRDEAHLILLAPREMWLSEFTRILESDNAVPALRDMKRMGLIGLMFPELAQADLCIQPVKWHIYDVWEHILHVVGNVPKRLRWAAFLHDIGKPGTLRFAGKDPHYYHHEMLGAEIVNEVGERFRMPKTQSDYLSLLVENHLRLIHYEDGWSGTAVLRIDRELGPSVTDDLAELARADLLAARNGEERSKKIDAFKIKLGELRKTRVDKRCILPRGLGERVMELLKLTPSKAVGDVKSELEKRILSGEIEESSEASFYDKYILEIGGRRAG